LTLGKVVILNIRNRILSYLKFVIILFYFLNIVKRKTLGRCTT